MKGQLKDLTKTELCILLLCSVVGVEVWLFSRQTITVLGKMVHGPTWLLYSILYPSLPTAYELSHATETYGIEQLVISYLINLYPVQ